MPTDPTPEPERQREPSPEALAAAERIMRETNWAGQIREIARALDAAREQGRREQYAKSCSCICHEDGRAILEQGRREGLEDAARFVSKRQHNALGVLIRALADRPQAKKRPV